MCRWLCDGKCLNWIIKVHAPSWEVTGQGISKSLNPGMLYVERDHLLPWEEEAEEFLESQGILSFLTGWYDKRNGMMFNIGGMNYLVRLDLLGSNLDTLMWINQKL